MYISAALSTRGGYKLTGTYSINGRYALSNIALTIYGSNLYLYLKGEYQFAHFTLTAASDSFTPQTSEVTTVTSSVGGTDVFSQLYPSAFSVNIGAVSSTYVTSVYTYTPDAMNGCMVYYYALEASQEGELQMITKNSNGSAVLAIASGETGY